MHPNHMGVGSWLALLLYLVYVDILRLELGFLFCYVLSALFLLIMMFYKISCYSVVVLLHIELSPSLG